MHTFDYPGFFSTWHQSSKKYVEIERWVPVIPVDFIIHDEAHPFCDDPDCPCHQQNDLAWTVCWQPLKEGLLTPREAVHIFYGKQV